MFKEILLKIASILKDGKIDEAINVIEKSVEDADDGTDPKEPNDDPKDPEDDPKDPEDDPEEDPEDDPKDPEDPKEELEKTAKTAITKAVKKAIKKFADLYVSNENFEKLMADVKTVTDKLEAIEKTQTADKNIIKKFGEIVKPSKQPEGDDIKKTSGGMADLGNSLLGK